MGTNAKVVEEAYAAFGRGDIAGILELLDENVEWTSPRTLPHGGQYHGRLAVAKFFENIGAAWNPLTLKLEELGEISDGVVVGVAQLDGTLTNGDAAGYASAHVFHVRDGKITRFREYTDLDGAIVSRG